jgi:hypothetical protein
MTVGAEVTGRFSDSGSLVPCCIDSQPHDWKIQGRAQVRREALAARMASAPPALSAEPPSGAFCRPFEGLVRPTACPPQTTTLAAPFNRIEHVGEGMRSVWRVTLRTIR